MTAPLSQWLRLREPFDAAARSADLAREVSDMFSADRPIRIVDLGTGRGSNVRYLAEYLPRPQHWLLVDEDPALLAEVPSAMSGALPARVEIEARCLNLGRLDADLFDRRDLVTASALLDLVSGAWMRSVAELCRANGASALFALSYNGHVHCSPEEPEDAAVCDLMNAHQRANDKGFGTAAGPEAAAVAAASFSALGFAVRRTPSNWALPPDARALQRELIDGWADAAVEIAPARAVLIRDWRARRLAHLEAGDSRIVVGHDDLAAWLPRDRLP